MTRKRRRITAEFKKRVALRERDTVQAITSRHEVHANVREIQGLLNLPLDDSPGDLDLIEQVILARNAAQHPERITDMVPQHRHSDLTKHPRPFLRSEFEGAYLDGDLAEVAFLVPRVRVSREQLKRVVDEAERLAVWFDQNRAAHCAAR